MPLADVRCEGEEAGGAGRNEESEVSFDIPSTYEMAALEVVRKRFGSREADKNSRMKIAPNTGLRRSIFDIPRRRGIHRRYGDFGLFEGCYDGPEWFPNLA